MFCAECVFGSQFVNTIFIEAFMLRVNGCSREFRVLFPFVSIRRIVGGNTGRKICSIYAMYKEESREIFV